MQQKLVRLKKRYRSGHRKRVNKLKLFGHHPFAVPVVTLALLSGITGGVIALRAASDDTAQVPPTNIVIISYDHHERTVPSNEPTVGSLLRKLSISLHEGDVVEPALETPIKQDAFRINIYRAVPVKVVDSAGQTTFGFSAATTPRSIARQAGYEIYPEDAVSVTPVDNFIRQQAIGEQVVIDRATPVDVNLYGSLITMRTHAKTVGGLLAEKHIVLGPTDTVMPAPSTPITQVQKLFIDRNGQRTENISEEIPMPVEVISDPGLAYGTSAIRQRGSPGKRVVTYQIRLQNDKEVGRSVIQSIVTEQPVAQIVAQGTSLSGIKGDMALAGISQSDYQYADFVISHESGWCPTKAQGERGCPPVPSNPYTTGGYGLCQATPGSKMSAFGSDWATNPVTQLRWCDNYAKGRYGSWYGAYSAWRRHAIERTGNPESGGWW